MNVNVIVNDSNVCNGTKTLFYLNVDLVFRSSSNRSIH